MSTESKGFENNKVNNQVDSQLLCPMVYQVVYPSVLHTEQGNRGHVVKDKDGRLFFICHALESGNSEHRDDSKSRLPCTFATREEALKIDGQIYQHYKGGIYRVIGKNVNLCHEESQAKGGLGVGQQEGVVYEHLWPHGHDVFWRPQAMFEEPGRFKLVSSS